MQQRICAEGRSARARCRPTLAPARSTARSTARGSVRALAGTPPRPPPTRRAGVLPASASSTVTAAAPPRRCGPSTRASAARTRTPDDSPPSDPCRCACRARALRRRRGRPPDRPPALRHRDWTARLAISSSGAAGGSAAARDRRWVTQPGSAVSSARTTRPAVAAPTPSSASSTSTASAGSSGSSIATSDLCLGGEAAIALVGEPPRHPRVRARPVGAARGVVVGEHHGAPCGDLFVDRLAASSAVAGVEQLGGGHGAALGRRRGGTDEQVGDQQLRRAASERSLRVAGAAVGNAVDEAVPVEHLGQVQPPG